jgi:hypothetical protein
MSFKERIEDNAALWLLGTLLTGFIAGLGAYKGILEIAQLAVVPKTSDVVSLRQENQRLKYEAEHLKAENQKIRKTNAELAAKDEKPNGTQDRISNSGPSQPPATKDSQHKENAKEALVPDVSELEMNQIGTGKVQVALRDGTIEEYDDVLYMSSKPPGWAFDLYAEITDSGLTIQRSFPMANIRVIEFGKELLSGHIQVIETKVELLNGLTVSGWQYGARGFYLINKALPEAARQDVNTLRRIAFSSLKGAGT